MYKVTFNTKNFESRRNRRDWEDLLRNDFAVAINGKEFTCETDEDLENRFGIIAGHETSIDDNDYFYLEDEKYNKQRLMYGMYGIPQGYVSFDKTLNTIKAKGKIEIPFSSFYDIRQGNFFKGCYIEIKKL